MYMSPEIPPKTLGLEEDETNALYAWQNGLYIFLIYDPELRAALKRVKKEAKEKGYTRRDLMAVPIDKGWVLYDLLKAAGDLDEM